jgi:hypothetical protein
MKHTLALFTALLLAPLTALQVAGVSKPCNEGNRHEPIQ